MPAIIVIDAGGSSVQGLGRYGSQRYGIAPGGAMDRMALAQANALAGQPWGAAAIEIGPLPAKFQVVGGMVRVALSGADRQAFVNDRSISLSMSHVVCDGETLSIRGARRGQYTYLAAQGGLHGRDVEHQSLITAPQTNSPRNAWVFCNGDAIAVRPAASGQVEQQLPTQSTSSTPIRVVLGPQLEYFSQHAVTAFLATPWTVSHASNRMAYVLEGGRVQLHRGFDIVSDGTVTGNIQIAGSGQPIAILRDRGTVGGYPKIATIISADIGRFAQTTLSDRVQFEAISVVEAQVVARNFAFELANLKPKLEPVKPLPQVFTAALMESNVAGDTFNPLDISSEPLSTMAAPGA